MPPSRVAPSSRSRPPQTDSPDGNTWTCELPLQIINTDEEQKDAFLPLFSLPKTRVNKDCHTIFFDIDHKPITDEVKAILERYINGGCKKVLHMSMSTVIKITEFHRILIDNPSFEFYLVIHDQFTTLSTGDPAPPFVTTSETPGTLGNTSIIVAVPRWVLRTARWWRRRPDGEFYSLSDIRVVVGYWPSTGRVDKTYPSARSLTVAESMEKRIVMAQNALFCRNARPVSKSNDTYHRHKDASNSTDKDALNSTDTRTLQTARPVKTKAPAIGSINAGLFSDVVTRLPTGVTNPPPKNKNDGLFGRLINTFISKKTHNRIHANASRYNAIDTTRASNAKSISQNRIYVTPRSVVPHAVGGGKKKSSWVATKRKVTLKGGQVRTVFVDVATRTTQRIRKVATAADGTRTFKYVPIPASSGKK